MHYRDKKGKFKSKKSYYKDLKAQEAKINLATHRVDDAVKEDHSYCKDKPPNPDLSDLGLGASVDVHQTCQFKPIPDDSWKSGRRIVELDVLAKRMFCASCKTPLHLSNIESERRYGLGSILFIRCQNNVCWALNDVKTGKRSQGAFDVNSKLALAVVHTGLGPVQVNNLLTTINLPPVDPTTLKRREYKIDSTLETIAKLSCNEAQKEENEMGNGKMEVSFDGGWQKRGTGWNYDSNTGHGSLIGKETGKIIKFSIRSKSCHVCSLHQNKDHAIPSHDCSKNWDGSSKGMEPDMAITMARDLEKTGNPINIIHGDNDSTTKFRLQADFPYVEKRDDTNHTKKSITSKLYKLRQKYKVLRRPNVISYIGRCIMYAIKESQEKDPEKLRMSLDLIVPHLYGDHSKCAKESAIWCSYLKNPSKFRYRSLPEGKPLTCVDLKSALTDVINNLKDRAAALTNLGSTQANENFNFIVSTKAPKNKSFGSSKSLTGRISASVLQKNEGHGYLSKVNKAVGLSPGQFTMKLAMKTAAKRKLQKAKQMSIQGKRKRLVKKIKKSCKEATNEVHEGVTYSKYAELDHDKEQESTKTTEIPQRLTLPREKSYTYVTFDIETTGRGRDCEILQIAAGEDFNVYVHPRCNITEQASLVNGIQYNRDTNTMFHRGSEVRSKPIQDALLDFIDYIRKIPEPILVGHNVCNFDLPIIANKLKEFNLFAEFSKHIVGFVDTLKIARRVFKKSEVGNFQQENLVNKLTNCTFSAHDAKEDVRALTVLFAERLEKEVQDEDLFHISFHDVKKKYSELLQRKYITVAAAQKLARSGITPYHLQLAHGRNHGLKLLLDSFHVRLTTKYLSALVRFLEKEE